MKFETRKLGELVINFDRKRIPLSSRQRAARQGKYPYYGATSIMDYVDDFIFDGKYLLMGEDGTVIDDNGKPILQIANGKFWCNNHAHILQNTKLVTFDYLYYLLKNTNVQSLVTGAVQPKISQSNMNNLTLKIHKNKSEQLKIASFLRIFDEKIELNQKINENLERQARTICQQWLLDCDGQYTLQPLAEIAEINPDTYSPKENWEYVNYLDTSSITDGAISETQYINPETEKLPSRARRKVQKGDIVYSTVRPNQRHFGIIPSPLPNMLVSTGFAVIRSKHPQICNELIYLFITNNNFIEKMQQLAEQSTSTFPSIKPSDLGTCLIPYPIGTDEIALSKQLKTIYSLIATNNEQNKKLAAARDTLLPKLMAGEIDLQEA